MTDLFTSVSSTRRGHGIPSTSLTAGRIHGGSRSESGSFIVIRSHKLVEQTHRDYFKSIRRRFNDHISTTIRVK